MSALWDKAKSVVKSGELTQRQVIAMAMAFQHVKTTPKHSSFQKSVISKVAHQYKLSDSQKTYMVYLMSVYRDQGTEDLYKHYFDRTRSTIWGKAEIYNKILADDQWLYRSMLRIDSLQTDDEKLACLSLEWNGVGWSAFDVRTMTRLSDSLKQNGKLDDDCKAVARRRIQKYLGQLEKLANM